jgi:hypothetical protein
MKGIVLITIMAFSTLTNGLPAQTPAATNDEASAPSYEELPELRASEILRPEFLQGEHFKVAEMVPTFSGANRFSIESDFGAFEAEGNEMLLRRINEINAIAKLKEVSRTDQYKAALEKAARAPVAAAKRIASDPMGMLESAPKGIMKFMSRAGESVKGIGKKSDSDKYEGSKLEQISGFSDTKRKVAIELGVDPYSSNPVLQHELNEIAKAAFAGGATFSLATLPVGGAAGIGLTTTGVSNSLEETLREKSPTDLKILNRKYLLAMGANEKEGERFFANGAFSPTAQTAFVLNLKSLDGVANRRAFIKLASERSSAESDAIFCVQTAALMSKLHKGEHPLARLTTVGDFPICIAKDGTTIVALQWDYAAWTAGAARFSEELRKVAASSNGNKKVFVAVSGQTSPRLREEMEKLGHQLEDHLSPGPIK